MFTKILIANRGEIACRVISTAHKLGIQTVAIYSDADANAKHVAMADEAYRVGPAAARESYLQGERIIALAKRSGAQAIHPGYGFLSENAAFAQACQDAGIVFIGPPASAIAAMGSKSAAKTLMESASVPLVLGYHGDIQDAAFLQAQADQMGYPVLIKASAGGGGKGMRIVEQSKDFASALASCQREAQASFSDAKVLVERYLQRPRHIEVQVFGDAHGNCIYLFERDCSVQRRHQKVVEEAPAPGISLAQRQAMGQAAVNAAKAVGYQGAGTVEFIAEQSGKFYFMEMNTRLQVEHPVTEMITGLDLVAWQLQVASGLPLPLTQEQLRMNGHSIEARIYAENPEKGFLPSTGSIVHLRTPDAFEFECGGAGTVNTVRIDSGIREGDAITPFYDPMIAKLIVWGSDRPTALSNMAHALQRFEAVGLSTNIAFLQRLIGCPAFASADLDTGLIERNKDSLLPTVQAINLQAAAQAIEHLLLIESRTESGRTPGDAHRQSNDPWSRTSGFRVNGQLRREINLLSLSASGASAAVVLCIEYASTGTLLHFSQPEIKTIVLDERSEKSARVVQSNNNFTVFHNGVQHVFAVQAPDSGSHEDGHHGNKDIISAPMPGKVIAVMVSPGSKVTKGAAVIVMEAMKMEHTLIAATDGEVELVMHQVGDQVLEGAALVKFKSV
jgi:3-methylcrotonyl-CoA carboxylase alpha subunit